jgi:hypothetical protein
MQENPNAKLDDRRWFQQTGSYPRLGSRVDNRLFQCFMSVLVVRGMACVSESRCCACLVARTHSVACDKRPWNVHCRGIYCDNCVECHDQVGRGCFCVANPCRCVVCRKRASVVALDRSGFLRDSGLMLQLGGRQVLMLQSETKPSYFDAL